MSADILLSRLEKVRRVGPGRWTACCPAHESKSKSSLSVREAADGTVLIHDFGGCTVHEIAAALGIELTDLFPPKPEGKESHRPRRPRLSLADVAEVVTHELAMILIILNDIKARGMTLMSESEKRLFLTAANRLQTILNEAQSL